MVQAPTPAPAPGRARARLGRLRPILAPAVDLVAFGWVLWTGRTLVRVFRRLHAGDGPSGRTVRIFRFQNTADGPVIDGFGLTYVGWAGSLLVLAQAALLVGAVVAATTPLPRRARLVLLLGGVALAVLWAGNAAWNLAWSFDPLSLGLTLLHLLGAGAMMLAVRRRLRPG